MAPKKISSEKEKKIKGILKDLQGKIKELEDIRSDLEDLSYEEMSPKKTRMMLEEIKVPPLELIREKKK